MDSFKLEENIINLISRNRKGVSINDVIEYLDYIDKVRYTQEEIIPILDKLIKEERIREDKEVFLKI